MRSADIELAQRCQDGDPAAFEDLYRAHAGRLYSLVFRMTGSVHDAEDMLQEVFLHAHRKLSSFRGDSTLGTWLYRLAVNHCLDVLRGRQAKMRKVPGASAIGHWKILNLAADRRPSGIVTGRSKSVGPTGS